MDAKQLATQEFSLERAKALNAYAELEQSIGGLFCTLLGAERRKAIVVFSKILTGRARIEILAALMSLQYNDQYDAFFLSLLKSLSKLDTIRNHIVHWIVLVSDTGGKPFKASRDIALHKHPHLFAGDRLFKHEILTFRRKARFIGLLFFYFDIYLAHGDLPAPGGVYTWQQIFQQPFHYPPQSDHPLYHTCKEP